MGFGHSNRKNSLFSKKVDGMGYPVKKIRQTQKKAKKHALIQMWNLDLIKMIYTITNTHTNIHIYGIKAEETMLRK